MTLIEAIKTGLPLKRRNKTFFYRATEVWSPSIITYINPKSFINPEFLLSNIILTKKDILANDWLVKRTNKSTLKK